MMMTARRRHRQAIAARVVALTTLALILFLPKIELDMFDARGAVTFAAAIVQPQHLP